MASIYKITNKVTGDFYIGSTTRFVEIRWDEHRKELNSQEHTNVLLQDAWIWFGEEAFLFELIETCSYESSLEREQWYIDNLNPSYNLSKIAGRVSPEFLTGRPPVVDRNRVCVVCGKAYEVPVWAGTGGPITCSEACRKIQRSKPRGKYRTTPEEVEAVCDCCGSSFKHDPRLPRRFCSVVCSNKVLNAGRWKGKKHSPETIAKMQETARQARIAATGAPEKPKRKPRVHSEATIEKMRVAAIGNRNGEGNKGRIVSETTRQKASLSKRGIPYSVTPGGAVRPKL